MLEAVVRQLLPPILLPIAKKVAKLFRKPNAQDEQRLASQDKLRLAYEKLNRGADANEIILRPDLKLNIHPDSRVPFQFFCWLAPEMVEEMSIFLSSTKDKKRLLDVGALHGIFSLVFAVQNRDSRVIAIDPSPFAFGKLLYNINKNNLSGRILPFECALSDTPGKIRMFFEWEHAVAAPLAEDAEASMLLVKTTGDSLCEQLGFVPDVIKIDVEGHEVKLVRGLIRTIQKAKPLLFVELHPQLIKREGDKLTELLDMLRREGYRAKLTSQILPFEQLLSVETIQRVVFEYGGEPIQ